MIRLNTSGDDFIRGTCHGESGILMCPRNRHFPTIWWTLYTDTYQSCTVQYPPPPPSDILLFPPLTDLHSDTLCLHEFPHPVQSRLVLSPPQRTLIVSDETSRCVWNYRSDIDVKIDTQDRDLGEDVANFTFELGEERGMEVTEVLVMFRSRQQEFLFIIRGKTRDTENKCRWVSVQWETKLI
jgi:hypothetical protein